MNDVLCLLLFSVCLMTFNCQIMKRLDYLLYGNVIILSNAVQQSRKLRNISNNPLIRQPELMGNCPDWQPPIAVIIV